MTIPACERVVILAAVMFSPWGLSHAGARGVDSGEDPAQRPITTDVIRAIGADGDGRYVVGDMVFTEAELAAVTAQRGAFLGSRWTGGKVYFTFDADIDESRRQLFRQAAALWSQVSGVQFFESAGAGNRIRVVIPDVGGNCSSYVGMIGGEQILNLGPSCWTTGTIAHEVGHALGLAHEQNRSDRASHVTVTTTGGGTSACNALITANWGIASTTNVTSYDFQSIMHYPSQGSLSSPSCPTGVTGTITAIRAQPAGLPSGSESACLTPMQCTAIMGRGTSLSLRDGWAMALRYGYRITVSGGGDGSGSISVSGHQDTCGNGCYLATPPSTFQVSATPAADSIVRFSGACSGEVCTISPSYNGPVQVSFIKESTFAKVRAIQSMAPKEYSEPIFRHGFEN